MKEDKAIVSALQSTKKDNYSKDFNEILMVRIKKQYAIKKRNEIILTYSSLVSASLALIGLGVYYLKDFMSWPSFPTSLRVFSSESSDILLFSIFIAVLTLALISLDSFLRRQLEKRMNKSK